MLSIGSLLTRPLPEGDFTAGLQDTAVLAPRWIDVDAAPGSSAPSAGDWAVVGRDTTYPDLDALITALDGGTRYPGLCCSPYRTTPTPRRRRFPTWRTRSRCGHWNSCSGGSANRVSATRGWPW
ncbi:hypothetical protein NKH77_45580 [Streptomyces sp. M19]